MDNRPLVIFAALFVTTQAVSIASPPFSSCDTKAYPPDPKDAVPVYTVNLDLPPKERWVELVSAKKVEIAGLIDDVKNLTLTLLGEKLFNFIINNLDKVAASLPHPYDEEVVGIASAADMLVAEITLYNIFYEAFTFCTSIIMQDPDGNLYHGRNLDFGLFMGWDPKKHVWRVAELLKPLVVQLKWQKGGKTVYESINYAGYVGILTAVKQGKFTFSFDERFKANGGFVGILEWILFNDHNQKWVSFLTREVMENAESYDEAKSLLSKTRLLAPVYFILGGAKPKEGSIITRWRDEFRTVDLWSKESDSGSWYLVETNYDQWTSPPFFDDRRTPAVHCLNAGGQKNASLELIYNVLSTRPILNKLTTYTSLMDVNHGMEAWLRSCGDPCWPW
ncbi:acid ceramidase-like [Palaemon carinicauda]|uniref:acid ceramidase-like n=1 Tax=Palaemon carinicauda TaxID=392227 RepID=UPI0035B5A492